MNTPYTVGCRSEIQLHIMVWHVHPWSSASDKFEYDQ